MIIINNIGGSSDRNIDGDNTQYISEKNGNIFIDGNNNGDVEGKNGNIKIHGENTGTIDAKNGNIKVKKSNKGSIVSKNGNIDVGGDNENEIEGKNGNISVDGNNNGSILNDNGTISVDGSNTKLIGSKNGNIIIRKNNLGEIKTSNGIIKIKEIQLEIYREGIIGGINIITSNSSFNLGTIISGSNVVMSGGKIIVDGVDVTNQKGGSISEKNKVNIKSPEGNIEIDFKEGSIKFNGELISVGQWGGYTVLEKNGVDYKILYKNQELTIGEDKMIVNGKR
ncbi:hypothetical protein K9M48_04250 [Candidatus Gracilibacteria bacterium]|nr:hypothetical protein [Candidatus Gracilibacteria bacterium]